MSKEQTVWAAGHDWFRGGVVRHYQAPRGYCLVLH